MHLLWFVFIVAFCQLCNGQCDPDEYDFYGTFSPVIEGCRIANDSTVYELQSCCDTVCAWTVERFDNETKGSPVRSIADDLIRRQEDDKLCEIKQKDKRFKVSFRCWEMTYQPRDCGIVCAYGNVMLPEMYASRTRAEYGKSRINNAY